MRQVDQKDGIWSQIAARREPCMFAKPLRRD